MTAAPAAAHGVVDLVLDRSARVGFGSPSTLGTAQLQRGAAVAQVGNVVRALTGGRDANVGREGVRPVGEATVDGRVCRCTVPASPPGAPCRARSQPSGAALMRLRHF